MGERLFANVIAGLVGYRMHSDIYTRDSDPAGEAEAYRQNWQSDVLDYVVRIDVEYAHGQRHYLRFGSEYANRRFTPSAVRTRYTDGDLSVRRDQLGGTINSQELGLYAEDELILPYGVRANLGVRLSGAGTAGHTARALELRASFSIPLNVNLAVKVSYAFMQQYMHLMTGSGSTLSRDTWIPFMRGLRPQRSSQVALGIARSFPAGGADVSLEGYYKRMDGQLRYRTFASPHQASVRGWPLMVYRGRGASCGAEFLARRQRLSDLVAGGPLS